MTKPHIPLDVLEQQAQACHACMLGEGRTNLVFGVGDSHARVLIVGEAPGKNEDLQGEPFVGAAGQYLNELLELADLDRDQVYIANVLKCRPPGNRNPQPDEIQACAPFLREQTRTINPEFIVTLGNFATKFILKTDRGITGLHGKLQTAGRFKVFPVFHPAAAIYDRTKRSALEEDFRVLGRLLKEAAAQHDAQEAPGAETASEPVAPEQESMFD
jgi:uracil-DNA glycosylase family 4